MGFKLVGDVTIINTNGPTPITPVSKDVVAKVFSAARTDTASTVKAVLPADASIIGIRMFGSTNSDAGTTATVTVTVSGVFAGTISTGTVDVKANGATTATVQMSALPNFENVPAATNTGDLSIAVTYAETGTASTTGGPWYFIVEYVR